MFKPSNNLLTTIATTTIAIAICKANSVSSVDTIIAASAVAISTTAYLKLEDWKETK